MSLEKTLAEVEVLACELMKKQKTNDAGLSIQQNGYCVPIYQFEEALDGIRSYSEKVYSCFSQARRDLKGKKVDRANLHFSDFAIHTKNLANNLNILLQVLYGDYRGDLKDLERNTLHAPETDLGQSLSKLFNQVHTYSKSSPIKILRDRGSHEKGHRVLLRCNSPVYNYPSGFCLHLPGVHLDNDVNLDLDAGKWLDLQAQAYLEMTKTILRTIADRDSEHFTYRRSGRKLKTLFQRTRNFYQRHSKPIAVALASTLLTAGAIGGSLGTIAYQNYQKQKEMKDTLQKIDIITDVNERLKSSYDNWEFGISEEFKDKIVERRKTELQKMLIAHPEYAPSYALKNVFGASSNLFERTVDNLQSESSRLGIYVDNYLKRAGIDPAKLEAGKAKIFLERREAFLRELKDFSTSQTGKVPTQESLKRLSILMKEQKNLFDAESEISSFFPRLK